MIRSVLGSNLHLSLPILFSKMLQNLITLADILTATTQLEVNLQIESVTDNFGWLHTFMTFLG